MLYNHTVDATYITESGRKKNKQARTWGRSKHKMGEVLVPLCCFLGICGYRERVSERYSHTDTRNADSSYRVGWPGFWVHRSRLGSRLSLTVASTGLSLNPFFSWLPWDLTFHCLLPVSFEISHASPLCGFRTKIDNWILSLALTHTHTQRNECPPSSQKKTKNIKLIPQGSNLWYVLFSSYIITVQPVNKNKCVVLEFFYKFLEYRCSLSWNWKLITTCLMHKFSTS